MLVDDSDHVLLQELSVHIQAYAYAIAEKVNTVLFEAISLSADNAVIEATDILRKAH